jgi:hypothetical protein
MNEKFEARAMLVARKHGYPMEWQDLRFGFKRAVIECSSYEDIYAVEYLFRKMKDTWVEHWACSIGTFSGCVYIMDAADHEELERLQKEDQQRLEDWWTRYHFADKETRRLMACGAIQ